MWIHYLIIGSALSPCAIRTMRAPATGTTTGTPRLLCAPSPANQHSLPGGLMKNIWCPLAPMFRQCMAENLESRQCHTVHKIHDRAPDCSRFPALEGALFPVGSFSGTVACSAALGVGTWEHAGSHTVMQAARQHTASCTD